jgi:exosortase C (VPDSG-CTERM-specific)
MIASKFPRDEVEGHRDRDRSPTPPSGQDARNLRLRGPVGFLVFGVLLVAVFSKPLLTLAVYVAGEPLHSHILLIPFVSAYLLYIRRHSLPRDYTFSVRWALIPLIAGAISLAAAWTPGVFGRSLSQNDYLALIALSFVCFVAAGGFFFLGRKWMAAAAFPFAFLIFMVPMPDRVADSLETASKLASADAASMFFNISGTPVLRDGVFFHLSNITLEVAQECSGIRSSWVLFITSLLAANMFLKKPWRRAVLVLAVIPLGILRNGLRIAFIGLLCVHFGPEMLHSVFHRRGGPPFFVLSLIPLFFLLWWLRRGEDGGRRTAAYAEATACQGGQRSEVKGQRTEDG